MSRAFVAFYMGDYDRDTQALSTLEHGAYFLLLKECWVHGSIPLEPAKRAKLAKLSLRDWNRVAPAVNPFFDGEGRNRRATREIEKADKARLKRAMAGHRGGLASGTSRAIRRSNAEAKLQLSQSNAEAKPVETLKPSEANQRRNITSTFSGAAREGAVRDNAAAESAASPAGFAEKAREALAKSTGIGSGELVATMAAKGWVKPC